MTFSLLAICLMSSWATIALICVSVHWWRSWRTRSRVWTPADLDAALVTASAAHTQALKKNLAVLGARREAAMQARAWLVAQLPAGTAYVIDILADHTPDDLASIHYHPCVMLEVTISDSGKIKIPVFAVERGGAAETCEVIARLVAREQTRAATVAASAAESERAKLCLQYLSSPPRHPTASGATNEH